MNICVFQIICCSSIYFDQFWKSYLFTTLKTCTLKQINKRQIKYVWLLIMKCIFDWEAKKIIQTRKYDCLQQSICLPFGYLWKFVCIGAILNDNISWSLFSCGFDRVELVQIAGKFALKQINKRKIKYLCLFIMKCIFDQESKEIFQTRKHGRFWQSTFLPFRYGRLFIWELFVMKVIGMTLILVFIFRWFWPCWTSPNRWRH